MQLPRSISFPQLLTQWAQILNPFINNPALQVNILKKVQLTQGLNTVNHGLGRTLQGWYAVRPRKYAADYALYDEQDNNSTPDLTLSLFSTQGTKSSPVIVDLVVF